jgi:AMP-binding enzyme
MARLSDGKAAGRPTCIGHEASRFSATSARFQRLEQTRGRGDGGDALDVRGCRDVMESPSWVADVLASYRGDGRPAHTYVRSDGPGLSLTRDQLREQVARRAGALAGRGVAAGDRVGLIAGEADAFMPAFLALLWLGAVAVPLPPPPSLGRRDAWQRRHQRRYCSRPGS